MYNRTILNVSIFLNIRESQVLNRKLGNMFKRVKVHFNYYGLAFLNTLESILSLMPPNLT